MRRSVPAILLVALVTSACAPAPEPSAPGSSAPALANPPGSPSPASPAPSASPTLPPAPTPEPEPDPKRSPALAEVPGREPAAQPTVRPQEPPDNRLAVSIARPADFVPQYTFDWCVGASIQMTRSIVTGDREESRASQRRYWEMARDRTVGSPYGGANPAGWAAALNDLGLGPYRLVSLPTFDEALTRAARALAKTGRPVGLVMWAGRHAWVMTGYEATGDPTRDKDVRVTRVRVMDPLYPHGSRWGSSPEPNQLVTRKVLRRQFVLRDRPDYDFGVEPGWLVVLPVS